MMVTTRRRADCAGVACEHTLGRQPLHLYGYLWAKPEFIVDDRSGCFSFVVPDTVLFKQQKPVKWFFTSRQEKGKILTKSKKNLNVTLVLQAFTEPRRPITSPRSRKKEVAAADEEAVIATYIYPDRASNGDHVMVVEHLTATGVRHLLLEREKSPISVLQRFVPTRSGYNHLIQSVFTPDSCLLRKCVNSNLVSDTRLCIPERTATFEADERFVKPRDIANREMRDQIEHMHLEMSNHLKKIIGKPVARNVAYFKHGADDRMYLLWSTMLSFESGSLAFAKNLRLSLSHQARLQHLIATTSNSSSLRDKARSPAASASLNNSQTKICPACRSILPTDLIDFFVTFKAVVNAFDAEVHQPTTSCVPPILESVIPPTSDQRFKELCSDKKFLYRTIALCQACAKQINSTRKVKTLGIPANDSSPSRRTTAKSDRDKPIYMQSAHSIFWGKVEREEVSHKVDANGNNPRLRPRSAATVRHSARVRTQTLPNGLTRASLKRLLPDIAAQSDVVRMDEPQHCMQKLAEHLRHRYGGSSVRLALARANIYPPTSHVPIELLRPIAEPGLLADVSSFWNEFMKTSGGDSVFNSIDLDTLDALLLAHTNGDSQHILPVTVQPRAQSNDLSTESTVSRASIFHPAPPPSRRPTSCSGVRSAPSRASRLSIRSQSTADVSVHDAQASKNQKSGDTSRRLSSAINENAVGTSNMTPTEVFTRAIDGSMYEVHVSPLQENEAPTIALKIHAIQLEDSSATDANVRGSHPHTLELILTTHEILQIFSRRSHQDAVSAEVPRTAEELVRVVLDELTIQDQRLVIRADETQRPSKRAISTHAVTQPSAVTDASLTPDELRFLQETLLRD